MKFCFFPVLFPCVTFIFFMFILVLSISAIHLPFVSNLQTWCYGRWLWRTYTQSCLVDQLTGFPLKHFRQSSVGEGDIAFSPKLLRFDKSTQEYSAIPRVTHTFPLLITIDPVPLLRSSPFRHHRTCS